ncbi:MAG: DUF2157 domain-containing protein [Planctomycetes bacterium]|nr:DUF2157 domain-containing protein [Planctomycetota bacterium]
MDIDARRKAQQRIDRIALFRAELDELEKERVLALTSEQRSSLDAHLDGLVATLARQFGADATESVKRVSWGMRIAVLLGGAALIAAAVLFLHRVWGSLPLWAQVSILTAAPLALLAAAEAVFRRRIDLYYVALLGCAAMLAFILELQALGTVCNLPSSHHALLAWGGFAVLTAYAFGLRLLLGAGLLLVCAYTAALWMAAEGWHWEAFFERSQFLLPAAAALYAVPWLTGRRGPSDFDLVYRFCGAASGLLALLISSTLGHPYLSGVSSRTAESLYQIAGMGLAAGVVLHGFRLRRNALVNLGAVGFVVFLYARLHTWCWHWMPKYLFFLMIGLTAILLAALFWRLRKRLAERTVS